MPPDAIAIFAMPFRHFTPLMPRHYYCRHIAITDAYAIIFAITLFTLRLFASMPLATLLRFHAAIAPLP